MGREMIPLSTCQLAGEIHHYLHLVAADHSVVAVAMMMIAVVVVVAAAVVVVQAQQSAWH